MDAEFVKVLETRHIALDDNRGVRLMDLENGATVIAFSRTDGTVRTTTECHISTDARDALTSLLVDPNAGKVLSRNTEVARYEAQLAWRVLREAAEESPAQPTDGSL